MSLLNAFDEQISNYDKEIERLQSEIDSLTTQLTDIQTKKQHLVSNETLYKFEPSLSYPKQHFQCCTLT